jgi:hypothetical protein
MKLYLEVGGFGHGHSLWTTQYLPLQSISSRPELGPWEHVYPAKGKSYKTHRMGEQMIPRPRAIASQSVRRDLGTWKDLRLNPMKFLFKLGAPNPHAASTQSPFKRRLLDDHLFKATTVQLSDGMDDLRFDCILCGIEKADNNDLLSR